MEDTLMSIVDNDVLYDLRINYFQSLISRCKLFKQI